MPFLENIVCLINDHFNEVFNDKDYAKKKVYGITQPVKRTMDKGFDIIPGYLENGNWKYVGPDDKENLIIYHKLNGNGYGVQPNSGYGNSLGLQRCVSDMSVIVFAMRTKLLVSQHQLEQKINENLLQTIPQANIAALLLNSVNINAVSSNMNMLSVWANEFQNVPYSLNEENILFELKYKIETIYKKECQPC